MPPRARDRGVTVTQRRQNLVEHSKVLTIGTAYVSRSLELFSWDSHSQYTDTYTTLADIYLPIRTPVELLFALSEHLAWPGKNIVAVNFTSPPLRSFLRFSLGVWYKSMFPAPVSSRMRECIKKEIFNTRQLCINCRVYPDILICPV